MDEPKNPIELVAEKLEGVLDRYYGQKATPKSIMEAEFHYIDDESLKILIQSLVRNICTFVKDLKDYDIPEEEVKRIRNQLLTLTLVSMISGQELALIKESLTQFG